MGRASPIEAPLSNTPFQPVSLPPPANAPYNRWAGCHFFRVLPHKGQGYGPRARKQVSTKTEPLPFRAAGQRRLQTECSKPPGTNAPGISDPASSPPLSETGWLQLGRASPIEATLSNTPFQPVSLPPPANTPYSRWAGCHFFRVLPRKGQGCGPRARKQVSTTTEPSLFRAAGQRRLQTERSKLHGTNAPGISDPANGNARKRFTTPCGYATFFIDPFHISKTYRPHKILPSGKIKRLQPCRIPHAKNFRPALFP